MHEPEWFSEEAKSLVDAYLDEVLDEAGMRKLETELLTNAAARQYFVEYCQLHTDIALQVRSRRRRLQ